MNISEEVIAQIKMHSESSPTREICGVIVTAHRKIRYLPCKNIAEKDEHFVIDPCDYANAEDDCDIMAIVHSHINVSAEPSQADLIGIEATGLPWIIINYPTGVITTTYPSGYEAPYVGRPFVHGITDCYSIWRDYYKRELNIEMKDYFRQSEWWLKGETLYRDYYKEAGFVEVKDLKLHDIILMKVGSPTENHAAVYIGDNKILQHIMNKVSSRDVYGGWYRKITTAILRHESLL